LLFASASDLVSWSDRIREEITMRAFLTAVVVAVVLAAVGGFILNKLQEPVSVAFSTEGVRL
jgi:hypothetical protein